MDFLIADGHKVARFGASLLLKSWWPDACVYEAASFSELLHVLSLQPVNLLLLEVNIPGGDNLRMIDQVKIKQPKVKILIFSTYKEQLYAEQYLRAGANGYLQKNASEGEMKKAIDRVLDGGYYVSVVMMNRIIMQVFCEKQQIETPWIKLTDREADIAHLLVKGVGVVEVAKLLNLHKTTISTYKARIFKKLNVSNMAELIEKFTVETPVIF